MNTHASDADDPDRTGDDAKSPAEVRRTPGGIIHSYQQYDPKSFPSPTTPPPDIAGAAMEHMLAFGSLRGLTPEQLAEAIRIDPSMFPQLGPSLESIAATLMERKRRILETYEVESARRDARRAYEKAAKQTKPPAKHRDRFEKAVREEQIRDLERLYMNLRDDQSDFASELTSLIDRLSTSYQIDQLNAKYTFTGRTAATPEEALELKEELEEIDKLLEQLKEAAKNAQLAIIDMDSLSEFLEPGDMSQLEALRQQIEDYQREAAAAQGLEHTRDGYQLTPRALKLFQGRVLNEIFAELQASRSGRHDAVKGEGPVELPQTKPYEFGDSVASMDVPGSFVNALVRQGRETASVDAENTARSDEISPLRLLPEDILIHRTRNMPRCATTVVLDMSGSMRNDGQYINAKRMALALDGLIRREYPGDSLTFIECFSLAKVRHVSEIPALMPKPVTIRQPVVRLRADLSDPKISEAVIPPHFTNIQQSLQIAHRLLAPQDTPNKQIMLITDGLPTAHCEGEMLYLLYPPDPRTEEATMRQARRCARDGIVINVFLLPNWWQSSEDVQFAHRLAEQTKGRVFFTAGKDLDRFVLWDYVKQRRRIIA